MQLKKLTIKILLFLSIEQKSLHLRVWGWFKGLKQQKFFERALYQQQFGVVAKGSPEPSRPSIINLHHQNNKDGTYLCMTDQ